MRRPLLLGIAATGLIAAAFACGSEESARTTTTPPDATPPITVPDARLPDPPPPDASDAAPTPPDASDAAPTPPDAEGGADAGPPPSPLSGVWQGTAIQEGIDPFTVLVSVHPTALAAPAGAVVGLMTYPSLGCGGYLTRHEPATGDAGMIDAGAPTTSLRLFAHESVPPEVACIVEGDDLLTLQPDGTLLYEYWSTFGGAPQYASGVLTRVGAGGPVEALGGSWAEPTAAPNGVRTLMASLVRTDTIGAPAGLFLRANADRSYACGGVWTLRARTSATDLLVDESFPAGQLGCDGLAPGGARLQQAGAQLQVTRATDAGPEPPITLTLGGR
ncbi:MAG: hypothetical protein IPQ09_00585 [Myxococcales bacterium]|nr:hypothetical protein [Myxococcales bacterium]